MGSEMCIRDRGRFARFGPRHSFSARGRLRSARGNREHEHPRPVDGLNLGLVDRSGSDSSVEVLVVVSTVRKELDLLKPVAQFDCIRTQYSAMKVPVEGQTGHLCSMAFHRRESPQRVGDMQVRGGNGIDQQRVLGLDARVQDANDRRIG